MTRTRTRTVPAQASGGLKVMRWGPYPQQTGVFGGGIGGYARYNSQALRSWLADEVEFCPVPMTVPTFRNTWLFMGDLAVRFVRDVVTLSTSLLLHRPDVLHVTALYRRSIYREAFAVWLARRLRVPVFYDIRAGIFEPFVEGAGPLGRYLARYVVTRSDRIAIQGRNLVPFIQEHYHREATWLPNCFLDEDLERYSPAPLDPLSAGEPLCIAYLGYLSRAKGVDVLLEAARILCLSRPVRITLLGHPAPEIGPVLERYVGVANLEVHAPGRVDLPDVLQTLRKQHIFAFPSRFFGEGHPNAVNEAMAMGLPVVASRQGFLGDIITPDVGRLLEDAEDADELARVLAEMAADWPALQGMGRNARRRMETDFSGSQVLKTTLRIYQACARAS